MFQYISNILNVKTVFSGAQKPKKPYYLEAELSAIELRRTRVVGLGGITNVPSLVLPSTSQTDNCINSEQITSQTVEDLVNSEGFDFSNITPEKSKTGNTESPLLLIPLSSVTESPEAENPPKTWNPSNYFNTILVHVIRAPNKLTTWKKTFYVIWQETYFFEGHQNNMQHLF